MCILTFNKLFLVIFTPLWYPDSMTQQTPVRPVVPLLQAITDDDADKLKIVLDLNEHGLDSIEGLGLLLIAIGMENSFSVKHLLCAGVNPNIDNTRGLSPLIMAIHSNNPYMVKYLVEAGADPNRLDGDGRLPLVEAIGIENSYIISYLLAAGADRNMPDGQGCRPWSKALSLEIDHYIELLQYPQKTINTFVLE